jgi:hypothetical protein
MISYERQFDLLVDQAELLSTYFAQREREVESLRAEKENLQAQLDELYARVDAGNTSSQQDTAFSNPFVKRPPGGYGDDVVEEELVREVDGDGQVDHASLPTGSSTPKKRPFLSRAGSSPLLHLPSPLTLLQNRRSSSPSRTPASSLPPSRTRTPAPVPLFTASPTALTPDPIPLTDSPSPVSPSSRTERPRPPSPSPLAPIATAEGERLEGQRRLSLSHPHLSLHKPRRRSSLSFVLPREHEERDGGDEDEAGKHEGGAEESSLRAERFEAIEQ